MVDERYLFDEHSYEAITASGLTWPQVLDALRHGKPRLRRHTGAVLQITARCPRDGAWIGVVLIEEDDEEYLVVSARRLDPAETGPLDKLFGGTG